MLESRSVGLRCVVLSFSLCMLLAGRPLRADETSPELPPPPTAETAELAPPDSISVETPPGEDLPALLPEGDPKNQANLEVPADPGLTDVPPPAAPAAASPAFSSARELRDVDLGDRIKPENLVLWLSLGPSYGMLTPKGTYAAATPGADKDVGGLGYNAGIGGMLDSTFQLQFDFTGTPKTKNTTVDQAMFGFGPRLGILSLMGVFGVQQGPDPTTVDNAIDRLFVVGARAGLDLVLKHGADSRVSVGLAPEAFYIVPQSKDGYSSAGVSVSLRIYGYDSAF